MRDIKFRGKRVDNGEWVYGQYLESDYKYYIVDCHGVTSTAIALADSIASFPGYYEVVPDSVGQYTGEADLWQGDVCTAEYCCAACFENDPHLLIGVIEQDGNGLWMFEYTHGSLPLDCEDLDITMVLGNVTDNPKLLEDK